MAEDHKDRLGNKLHDAEKAREDQWARQSDEKLLEQMRERLHKHACPQCKQFLVAKIENGVPLYACPDGHGAWLDAPALKTVLKEHKAG
jgi:Transcription factor zinc-finger